ncbi:MAG: iron ABC transporter permease [Acetobacteraceae bacterium]
MNGVASLPTVETRRKAAPPGRGPDLSLVAFAAVAVVLCVLVVLPLGWLAWYAVTDDKGALTLANFIQLFTDPALLGPLLTTFLIAAFAGVSACVVAVPIAWLVARTDMPLRNVVRALVTASFVTPPFLGAIAWELLAAPNSGLLNQAARWLLGLDPYDYVFDIYTVTGVVFAIACYTFPYVFTVLANALERVPSDLEDASAILGGRAATTLRRITLPLVLPALLAGGLIAFLQALTMFGTPAILAMPAGFHTLTTRIWSLFQYPPQTNLAAAAAMPLLVITLVVLQAQRWLLGRRSFVVVGGKNSPARRLQLGRWRLPGLGLCLLILMLPVFLPYFALLKVALVKNLSDPLSLSTLTFAHIRFALWDFSDTRLAMVNTMVLGVGSATIVTAMVLVVAYLSSRRLVVGHTALAGLAMAPLAVPGIVMGVGLFLVYSRPPFLLYGTLWILLIGFVTMELPAGFQQVQAALRGLHVELEDAARIFGATRLTALRQITAPLLRSTIIATWCIVFIGVIRELSATILLTTSNTKVISVVIYDLNESGDLGAISVLGLTLLLITFAVVLFVNRLPILGGRSREGGG